MEDAEDRTAEFRAVIAYKNEEGEKLFKGVCIGTIAREARGRDGFGFDPIFLPQEKTRTFAEDLGTKSSLSHRAQAIKKLIKYLN